MNTSKFLVVALAAHADAPVVDPQFASFRHFECFVNIRGSGVLCVHAQAGKQIVLAPRPPDQRRCRF